MIGSEVKGNLLPHSFFFSFFYHTCSFFPLFFTLTLFPHFLSHSFFSIFSHSLFFPIFFYTHSFFPFFSPHALFLNPSDYVVTLQGSCSVSKDLILMQQGTKIPEPEWFSQVEGIALPRAICSRWTAVTYHLTLTNANV